MRGGELEEEFDAAHIGAKVRELLERHGVEKGKHAPTVGAILGISAGQVYRKLRGDSPWSLNHIKALARHYGEAPTALVATISENEAVPTKGIATESTFVVGGVRLACLAWIGKELKGGRWSEYVATHEDEHWLVYPGDHAPAGKRYKVEEILIRSSQAEADKPSIAVLDDEPDVADQLAERLTTRGFRATAFYNVAQLRHALQKRVFDGFVVDWSLDGETAETCIRDIRASDNPDAPVLLLTGKLRDETGPNETETEIARVMREFSLPPPFEKPAKAEFVAAELARHLLPR
ncbi:response regulator (plasmid) [Burkholderia thailandensis]|uniref:helix-turn-helix domain-containing protein n=1 Tax=Burkholderia thailandensis TaxID=57975 RepID=UPI00192DCD59|nr:helix-turn-helix domain-containing protein [Burkholderia thailandensis]MBS2132351.1 response regulator [Burkholderia thailandensis]QRA15156.1 response regulator [Burkholderia thailandensis]